MRQVGLTKLVTTGAILLASCGILPQMGCIREKERVIEEPRRREVIVEKPKVIEKDRTIIERP